jgi:ornithine carbamoyltransferase
MRIGAEKRRDQLHRGQFFSMKDLLSIQALDPGEIDEVINLTAEVKAARGRHATYPLEGQTWAMIFAKSSTRTRVSFEVGVRELGGSPMFLSAHEIQLGRGEPIKDTARVMGRMIQGAIIRTFAQSDVVDFAKYSQIPTINALTDEEHPCQILADLFTIREKTGGLACRKICFIGDGACNVAVSWIWAAAKLGFELCIAAPPEFQPSRKLIDAANRGNIFLTDNIHEAAKDSEVLYTDVWVSMGKEDEASHRLALLGDYKIDDALVAEAKPGALVMHCLPAYRGKEIDESTLEAHAQTIFDQAENRLHAQKAILSLLKA